MMQREIKTRDLLQDLFVADIPTSSKMMPFCHLHSMDIFILTCSKETIKPTKLK